MFLKFAVLGGAIQMWERILHSCDLLQHRHTKVPMMVILKGFCKKRTNSGFGCLFGFTFFVWSIFEWISLNEFKKKMNFLIQANV
ncbi:hypothetical protein Y032_0087g2086 [Ancylostoma ceylanicum]|uniref:Uncharacterized protein n=1 Tax=Ancylostoma ceylanicum TaxID=53326 RepID=A0A016TQ75_9BILA|nr:hypothetical protein Y032_0087g2086 [Ancylostoma ceylanicum]